MLDFFKRKMNRKDQLIISKIWSDLFRIENELSLLGDLISHIDKSIDDFTFIELKTRLHTILVSSRKEKIYDIINFYERINGLTCQMIEQWSKDNKINEDNKKIFEDYLLYKQNPKEFYCSLPKFK